ncbi:PREDICTED: 2,3-bisphosphoglycerate-dependent phosphoglycerate mutase-like [Nicrophorus vespilloides]|uniref:phosphoglycerate mutase (2,3-diphosphoglycerate-dependent) n=1 Tax=Nicrophorus vespilloides TaxID=110193 RepID=A0ABM1MVZ2_NICVS|nr:PREDICTED: 2,3-bisphosphoglycerate-dependent phosphoglycerate mutase-like [Nicrophorus vespilloides]
MFYRSLATFRTAPTYKIVFVRHGQSEWNEQRLFTGWYDSQLTDIGKCEARKAGKALKNEFKFDIAYTSKLSRATETLQLIKCQTFQKTMKTISHWRLNERHYGDLTGKSKEDLRKIYGKKQVQLWRRSFKAIPPPIKTTNPFYECIVNDNRYDQDLDIDDFPRCESLKMTTQRVLPLWYDQIVPNLKQGKNILLVAHHNSLRAIIKHIEDVPDVLISNYQLPTGTPFVYTLNMYMKAIPSISPRFIGSRDDIEDARKSFGSRKNICNPNTVKCIKK